MRVACRVVLLLFTAAVLALAQSRPPVILISIDTLRADHLSAYGYRAIQTPHIDSFAQNGALLRSIDAQIPLTLPSHFSLFTSTYPFENRIEENAEPARPGAVTLASVLKARGYQTAAFIGSVFLEKEMGLDVGFDYYDSPFHFQAFSPLSGSMFLGETHRGARDRRDGALVIRSATQWLTTHRGQPVFAFVHLFDLHRPYERHATYDQALVYVDQLLGAFRKSLEADGLWDGAMVIVFSDHGEGLGEHGEASHGYFIYESTLHVPLLIHWPAASAVPQHPAGLIDVAPTILEWLHIPAPPSFEGKSLTQGDRANVAESVHAYDAFGWAPLRSLRSSGFKYIDAPHAELYDLDADPGELRNLFAKDPARAETMRRELRKIIADHSPARSAQPPVTSPQTTALLQSLGYLSGGPRVAARGPLADPKDRLPEFHAYEKVEVALSEARYADAVALLRGILAKDPANTLARRDLGSALLSLKQYGQAREEFERVLANAPEDYVSQYALGLVDEQLGQLDEAEKHLAIACRIAPAAEQCRRALDGVRAKRKPSRP
ncbi:MAG: sulfatase-like hydrolase/transferase [Acidobacteriaceae bacterium]|nr:sulfatase-like hydrolase/transferase [Acidobacteriaceae bacterium]